jgi:hypothetical protein
MAECAQAFGASGAIYVFDSRSARAKLRSARAVLVKELARVSYLQQVMLLSHKSA